MELREFQHKVVRSLSTYLTELEAKRSDWEMIYSVNPEMAMSSDFAKVAWEVSGLKNYSEEADGTGMPVPHTCIKVPTGGGKTLLACHAIDLTNKLYLRRQTGLVLWIVPTNQIYRQTLAHLRDRNHPYRQVLDRSSAGRTLVFEKLDHFTADDAASSLCVLLLMLPSAARKSKETLKVFKDNSGFTSFFPREDDFKSNQALVDRVPNLDTIGEPGGIYGEMPLTSLGNALRILRPITIVDEGHKSYSKTARETIFGFNPSFVLELSATPANDANVLVEVTGRELDDEQMIKLDLHVTNKRSSDWQDTVACAAAHRAKLEKSATKFEKNTGRHIRPIMLVQVERTGKDTRDGKLIHAEDVRDYLLKQLSVPDEQIAVKSSERDDIEGIDLLAKDCQIRFIITKQALQEGWDCSFAYVLCSLASTKSEAAMTQLIGRILRQPYATKTGQSDLDESYVFSYQQDTAKLVGLIKRGLEGEGLADLAGRVATGDEDFGRLPYRGTRYRDRFKKFEGKIYLPLFAIERDREWREVNYEADLLSAIDWDEVNLSSLERTVLDDRTADEESASVGFRDGRLAGMSEGAREYESRIHPDEIARRIVDVVPNPWVAYGLAERAIDILLKHHDSERVAANLVYAVEDLRMLLVEERDRISEKIFNDLLKRGEIKFYILKGHSRGLLPSNVPVRSRRNLTRDTGEPVQRSLFDWVADEDVNGLEREVALFLDEQERLLWWFRNAARTNYRIQGWHKHGVYPDFIAATDSGNDSFDTVYVLETKGTHLQGAADTEYKRALLDLCSRQAVSKPWDELGLIDSEQTFTFHMIDEATWRSQINGLVGED